MRAGVVSAVAVGLLLVLAAPASAQQPINPNDLLALGEGQGDTPDRAPIEKAPTVPFFTAPRAKCGPGSKPEPDIQGRVPAGSAAEGLWCNMTLVSHQGASGGFKVFDYVDERGRECAFYDTALVFPANAFNLDSSSLGVAVLDMTNPAKPVQTAALTEPAMLSPHESVALNERRGLIAAVSGNPATYPGWVSIYDASDDCRNPVLQFSGPIARLGHESGFSEDGRTFYATATAFRSITAIDVTDPKAPSVLWHGQSQSHGMSLSDDGNRAYLANPDTEETQQGDMVILDTSQIQARVPNPHTREISRITWDRASIPQNTIPITVRGKPYVLEFDEYNASTLDPSGDPDHVGAGRFVDISDERKPRIVSHLRLEINEPDAHRRFENDPGADGPANGGGQGYALHYCNVPTRVDPKIVACSFIVSGLRLFDISDIEKPREIAYYVAPAQAKPENQGQASNYAMSQPAFVPERREVWFSDATGGFYALRVAADVWPKGASEAGACLRPAKLAFKIHRTVRAPVVRVDAFANGRRVLRRKGSDIRRIELAGLKRTGRLGIRIVATHASGSKVVSTRTWNGCRKGKPKVRRVPRRR